MCGGEGEDGPRGRTSRSRTLSFLNEWIPNSRRVDGTGRHCFPQQDQCRAHTWHRESSVEVTGAVWGWVRELASQPGPLTAAGEAGRRAAANQRARDGDVCPRSPGPRLGGALSTGARGPTCLCGGPLKECGGEQSIPEAAAAGLPPWGDGVATQGQGHSEGLRCVWLRVVGGSALPSGFSLLRRVSGTFADIWVPAEAPQRQWPDRVPGCQGSQNEGRGTSVVGGGTEEARDWALGRLPLSAGSSGNQSCPSGPSEEPRWTQDVHLGHCDVLWVTLLGVS